MRGQGTGRGGGLHGAWVEGKGGGVCRGEEKGRG